MNKPIILILGLFVFATGCSSGAAPQAQKEQAVPFTWAHFEFFPDGSNATLINIGLSGGLGKFGLNVECLAKGTAPKNLNAYVWVDKEELDQKADIRVKWDDGEFKTEHWNVSSRALTPPQTTQFVDLLRTKKTLTVEYVPLGGNQLKTIVLPLAGADAQMKQYCPVILDFSKAVPIPSEALIKDDDSVVPPETVRVKGITVFGAAKTVVVSNQEGRYTRYNATSNWIHAFHLSRERTIGCSQKRQR